MSQPPNPFAPPSSTATAWPEDLRPEPQPQPERTTGEASLALVLGVLGSLVGSQTILFWMGLPLGVAATALGAWALERSWRHAPSRALAMVATAVGALAITLSAVGLVRTLTTLTDWEGAGSGSHSARAEHPSDGPDGPDSGTPVPESSPSLPKAAGASQFGEPFRYGNGVEVTVRDLTPYQPVDAPNESRPQRPAVSLTVVIVNGSAQPLDLRAAVPTAIDHQSPDRLWQVHDQVLPRPFEGTLAPGATATAAFGFQPTPGARKLTFEISPGLDPYDGHTWTGRLP